MRNAVLDKLIKFLWLKQAIKSSRFFKTRYCATRPNKNPMGQYSIQEQYGSPLTEQINAKIQLYLDKKLTQRLVNEWLNTIPEDKRNEAINQLEEGLCDIITNLPE